MAGTASRAATAARAAAAWSSTGGRRRCSSPTPACSANQIRHLVRERQPAWIVLQCEAITDIDVTAAEMLERLDNELNAQGVHLAFVELRTRLTTSSRLRAVRHARPRSLLRHDRRGARRDRPDPSATRWRRRDREHGTRRRRGRHRRSARHDRRSRARKPTAPTTSGRRCAAHLPRLLLARRRHGVRRLRCGRRDRRRRNRVGDRSPRVLAPSARRSPRAPPRCSRWSASLSTPASSTKSSAPTCTDTPSSSIGEIWTVLPLGRLVAADVVLAIATLVGLALFVVPGVIVFTLWSLVGPVITIEDRPVGSAFRRSWQLVRPLLAHPVPRHRCHSRSSRPPCTRCTTPTSSNTRSFRPSS